jgi:uroporphyrinogen-III decarboxylase
VPHFELSFDLPLFFRQVFELLLSDCKSLRTKAEECLKKFLHVFREILALGGGLSTKLRAENAQMLVETVLLLIRQNLSP